MAMATENISPADARYGYAFGVDGVVNRQSAQTLLDCHHATLYRLCKRGIIRRGRLGGRARFCRRSIADYLSSIEA